MLKVLASDKLSNLVTYSNYFQSERPLRLLIAHMAELSGMVLYSHIQRVSYSLTVVWYSAVLTLHNAGKVEINYF